MSTLFYTNLVLMCIDLLFLPALPVYFYRKKNQTGNGSLMFQYLFSAVLLYLLTRAVAAIPAEVVGILGISLNSRFFASFCMVVTSGFILLFYFLNKHDCLEIRFLGSNQRPASSQRAKIIGFSLGCAAFLTALLIFVICRYLVSIFDVSFREIIYTLASPLNGAAIQEAVLQLIPTIILVVLFISFYIAVCKKIFFSQTSDKWSFAIKVFHRRYQFDVNQLLPRHVLLFSLAALLLSAVYTDRHLQISDYFIAAKSPTTLYEDYYAAPSDVAITGGGKNLIYIYMESMETTYSSKAEGGQQPEINYIPELTALAEENLSFSNSDQLGGFRPITGTTWTMASLFATTSGIPFSFPIQANHFNKYENVATGVTTLGDILEEQGYQNEFLCGSDASFGGRAGYFQQHGNYKIYDLYTAKENGVIPEDYHVWWGFEDEILYSIAKDELLRLSQQEQPFNLAILTVDTHFEDGYICNLCRDDYNSVAENVVSCADRQIAEFIRWCQSQDFYQDTVIVISGDHPRMDKDLVQGVPYVDRTVYNCFVNCGLEARNTNREFTAMDLFPTVLSAMGFQIEGNRLGLGVNLFSEEQTLCEMLGFDALDIEIGKYSPFFNEHFL